MRVERVCCHLCCLLGFGISLGYMVQLYATPREMLQPASWVVLPAGGGVGPDAHWYMPRGRENDQRLFNLLVRGFRPIRKCCLASLAVGSLIVLAYLAARRPARRHRATALTARVPYAKRWPLFGQQ